MSAALLRGADMVVTMDASRREIANGDLRIENWVVAEFGPAELAISTASARGGPGLSRGRILA